MAIKWWIATLALHALAAGMLIMLALDHPGTFNVANAILWAAILTPLHGRNLWLQIDILRMRTASEVMARMDGIEPPTPRSKI